MIRFSKFSEKPPFTRSTAELGSQRGLGATARVSGSGRTRRHTSGHGDPSRALPAPVPAAPGPFPLGALRAPRPGRAKSAGRQGALWAACPPSQRGGDTAPPGGSAVADLPVPFPGSRRRSPSPPVPSSRSRCRSRSSGALSRLPPCPLTGHFLHLTALLRRFPVALVGHQLSAPHLSAPRDRLWDPCVFSCLLNSKVPLAQEQPSELESTGQNPQDTSRLGRL